MTEIRDISLPEVTLEELFIAQGADYSKRPPRASVVELNKQMLNEARELAVPKVLWRQVNVEGAEGQEMYLEGDYKLTSRLLVRMAGKAEKLLLLAVTIGPACEERAAAYSSEGKASHAFALDAASSAIIAKASMAAMTELETNYKQQGLNTSFPMGPGHSYWDNVQDLQIMFKLLMPEQIGLSLTESNLIMPKKSIAFVMGVGKSLPANHDKTHCDYCSLNKTCTMRDLESRG